ncbi:esterase [Mycobacterium sp. URHB0044]|jgi:hypothetical protein|uniref:esterase n=1 Tax=Mycobacterium sp. URHB0044 TaxID=1380386 RepID=UPI0004907501|nr:esterase [Mycobacterium sp. URHB0044]
MSTRKALIALTAAAAFVVATACGPSSTAEPSTSTSAAPAAQSACADLAGTVDADQTCRVHAATPTYVVDMTFPVDYPDQQSLSDVLRQEYDSFIDWVAQFGQPARGRPYEKTVTATSYSSGTPESGTRTLVLKVQSDAGLAHEGHPNTSFDALNYNLAKHAAITFDTLFKPGTQPLETLNPIVLRELQKPGSVVNDLSERTYQNFALTDDAVLFFFAQDQVIVDNNGSHRVSVPKAELASLLA